MLFWSLLGCSDLHYYFPQDPMEMALVPSDGAMSVVRGFTSADLKTWAPLPEPIAYGMSSLGLSQTDDELILTGIQEVRPPSYWEENVTGAPIRGLAFDGETWHPRSWPVDDPGAVGHIDPQAFEGGFWYIAPTGQTGDPVEQLEMPVRSSPPPTERYVGQGIADPAPIRIDGELHVFVTRRANILHLSGEPLTVRANINGATVPFPVLIDGQLHLLAQRATQGRRQPVLSRIDLEGHSPRPSWRTVVDIGEINACTSPVMGRHPKTDEWLLLCVEERRAPGGPAGAPPPEAP